MDEPRKRPLWLWQPLEVCASRSPSTSEHLQLRVWKGAHSRHTLRSLRFKGRPCLELVYVVITIIIIIGETNSFIRNARVGSIPLPGREAWRQAGQGPLCGPAPRSPARCPYSVASLSFTGVFWSIDGFSKGSSSGVPDNLPKDMGKAIDVNFVLLAMYKPLPASRAELFASF